MAEWKEIAVNLKMDEDTISFIESEPNDVKEQTKKILQLWKVVLKYEILWNGKFNFIHFLIKKKEREEKKAFPTIVLQVLRDLNKTELANIFEKNLNERI